MNDTKHLAGFLLSALLLLLSSCGNEHFTIECMFTDAGTQNLRFIYVADSAVDAQWIPSVNGKCTMIGASDELTVVYIYNSRMKFLNHVAIRNGETIELTGTLADNYSITATGDETAERWNGFIRKHAQDFATGNTEATDKAIADYVAANPKDVVSTLLVTCDYSNLDSEFSHNLMESIDSTAKPHKLTMLYDYLLENTPAETLRLTSLALRNNKDSLELLRPEDASYSLYYFWREPNAARDSIVDRLRTLDKDYGKHVRIADICTNYNLNIWRTTTEEDSVGWKHFIAQSGPVDRSISNLNIRGANYFILTDSTGTQVYRGTSPEKACKAIEDAINKNITK